MDFLLLTYKKDYQIWNIGKYSVSKINSFKQCKRLFKYRYIDKIKIDKKSEALDKGSLIHELIENTLIHKTKPNITTICDKYVNLNSEKKQECKEIYDKFCESSNFKVISSLPYKQYIENWFNFDSNFIPSDRSTYFTGKIDYYVIDSSKGIGLNIDWKTGKFNENPDLYQLEVYALWMILKYKLKGVKSKYYYVEHDRSYELLVRDSDIERIKHKIKSDIDNIESCDKFDLTLSPLCDYCDYYSVCNE